MDIRSRFDEQGLYALAVPFVVLALIAWSFADPSASRTPPAEEYTIVVERTDDGLALTCEEGCAWKESTWECADQEDCKAKVDFDGVGPVSESP